MGRRIYEIPRDTKGEGKILMIFSKRSFLTTVIAVIISLFTVYLICRMLGLIKTGLVLVLLSGLIGFIIGEGKMPESSNFEILRKTGGENIGEVIRRYIKFKRKGKKVYLYFAEGKEDE